MSQVVVERNPFMLMMHPELVLAAVAKSERLEQLNRHLCRPLDKPAPGSAAVKDDEEEGDDLAEKAS
jgi:hypothetical protein